MAGPPRRIRTVRRSDVFAEQAEALNPSAKRLDDQLRGVEWAVATRPEIFPQIPATEVRHIKTRPFPAAPPLRILFTIDDEDTCTLQYVERMPEPAAEEDYTG